MRQKVGLSKSLQVAQTLEHEIRSGRMSNGHRLASENELVRRFSVSRNTVRKGLETLARRGLITTRTGIGSFVTYDGASIDSAHGWTRALDKTASKIETRILGIRHGPCPATENFLGLDGMVFLCVDRLRLLQDGVGISLEQSRSPWREAYGDIPEQGLVGGSLAQTHKAAGLFVDHGEEWAEVLPALSSDDAKLMGRSPGDAMLRLRRVTRTAKGEVIEFVDSILDPQRFGLHLEF
ncbi:MAG: GntR family transcriptional regulator, partial [Alphaproteobacteria bacterium]